MLYCEKNYLKRLYCENTLKFQYIEYKININNYRQKYK